MNEIRHKYPYLSLLATINGRIIKNTETSNLRFTEETDLSYLDNTIKKVFHSLTTKDKDETLITLLNSSGHLLYYQPFFDGNSRTIKIFINLVLNKLEYNFEYGTDEIIITMLFDGGSCTSEEITKFKKALNYPQSKS